MLLNLNPYKLFEINNIKYLFVSKTGAIYELDEGTSAIIEQDGKDIVYISSEMNRKFGISQKEIEATLDEFHNVGLLGDAAYSIKLDYSLKYLHGIELMVCQCCNLACKYCYATEGEYQNPGWMSENVGKKAIDFLLSHAQSDSVRISFFGGEPLLNKALIKDLVEYAKGIVVRNKKSVSFAITTNGTLIDDDFGAFLRENNFYISLSVDGTRDNHDACRVNKAGCGSYDDTIKNIHILDSNQITLRATSTPQNCDYVGITNALFDLGGSEFFIGEAMNCFCTESALQSVEVSYDSLIAQFISDLISKKVQKCKSNLLIYHNLKKVAHFKQRSCSCSAFISTLAVDIDGNVFPCHRFVGSSYCIGNIATGEIDAEFAKKAFVKDFMLENRNGCSECWAQNLCVGGCSYLNWEANGQCDKPNTARCRLNKYLFEKIVSLYLSLTTEQKDMLELG